MPLTEEEYSKMMDLKFGITTLAHFFTLGLYDITLGLDHKTTLPPLDKVSDKLLERIAEYKKLRVKEAMA
jgi:hypothetical protein